MSLPTNGVSEKLLERLTWGIVLAGCIARLVRFASPFPLWGDEIFVCQNFHDRDFITILDQLENGQICPPLFLWAQLAIYKLFGGGEQSMRFLPVVAGLAGIIGFASLARRLMPSFPAFLAVGFLSVAIWPVNLSTFAKPYSLDLAAAVAVLALMLHWYERPASPGRGLLFALGLPLALLGSYTAAFCAGAALLVLLLPAWRSGWTSRGLYALAGLGVLAAFAFVLNVGKAQLDTPDVPIKPFLFEYWRNGFPPDEWWRFPLWLLEAVTGRMFAYPVGDSNGASSLTFIAAVIGAVAWWKTRPRWQFVLLLTPIVLNLIAALMWRYPFGACARLSQYAAPTICLFAGYGVSTLLAWKFPSPRATRIATWVYTLAFVGLAIGHVTSAVMEPFHDPEAKWVRDTFQEFTSRLRPEDRIVVRGPKKGSPPIPRWYLQLLGDRVTWDGQWSETARNRRVWVVDFWQGSRTAPHTKPPVNSPPGWEAAVIDKKEYLWPPPDDEKLTVIMERFERTGR